MEYIILGVVLFIIIVLVTRIKIVPQDWVHFMLSGRPVRIFLFLFLTELQKRFLSKIR